MGYWSQRLWEAQREGQNVSSYDELDNPAPVVEPEEKPKKKSSKKKKADD